MDPLEQLLAKYDARTPIGAALRTEGWQAVFLALRERGFFSAGVENVRWLDEFQKGIRKILDRSREPAPNGNGDMWSGDRGTLMAEMLELGQKLGIQPADPDKKGTLQEPLSYRRMKLIIDTQVAMAYGYGNYLAGQDPAVLDMWPAQELVRIHRREVPRNWNERWLEAAAAVQYSGVAADGSWIALKTSPIWARLSRFGTPWPPYDFYSGMGVEDVERDAAVAAGLLGEDEVLEPSVEDFNRDMEASLKGVSQEGRAWLTQVFGDQVKVFGETVTWRSPDDLVKSKPEPKVVIPPQWLDDPENPPDIETIKGLEETLKSAIKHAPGPRASREERSRWESLVNRIVEIPESKRGSVYLRGIEKLDPKLADAIRTGEKDLARYVNKKHLPTGINVEEDTGSRGFHLASRNPLHAGIIGIPKNPDPGLVAHEIVHEIENKNPEILTAAVKFREKRHGSAPPEKLKDLYPLSNYDDREITKKDKFADKGGSHYDGKVYQKNGKDIATEILTQGVQRLIRDGTAKFLQEDPEYCIYVLKTLRL